MNSKTGGLRYVTQCVCDRQIKMGVMYDACTWDVMPPGVCNLNDENVTKHNGAPSVTFSSF